MKALFTPVGWMFLAVAAASGFLQRPEGVFLGIGGFVLTLVVGAMRFGRRNREANILDQVANEDRARLAPLAKAKQEIDKLIDENRNDSVVKVLGVEVQAEAERILEQGVRLLNVRTGLRRARNAQADADETFARIRKSLESASTEAEREMLQSALDAREAQQRQIERAEDAMDSIDANLAQAAASLSELRTRLLLAAAGSAEFDTDDMRNSFSQLEALSSSFDEAEAVMKGSL